MYKGNLIDSVRRRCLHVSCTEEYTLLHYGHESEKLHFEPSQNATVTNCDNSGILAVAFCDLSHFVIIAMTAQTESNNTENVFWVLGRVPRLLLTLIWKIAFLPILALFHCYICLCVCISVIKSINQFTKETLLVVTTSICTCLLHWRVYPFALRTWIWEVAFWTVTKCDSHKLRQFRNPCRRILWFVAFCDHCRDGTNWVQ